MKAAVRKIIKGLVPNSIIRRRLNRKGENCILLTFDDGPHPKTTPQVLKRLHDHRVRAVFFVVGRFAEKNPDLLSMIAEQGHIIGNHTYDHPNNKPPGFFPYRRDIIKCQETVRDAVGSMPKLFRPARGIITTAGLLAAKSAGLKHLFWSSEGGEWGNNKIQDAAVIAKKLLDTAHSRDIILLHDNNPKMPGILDIILPALRLKGIDLMHGVNFLD
jgi:peptidoglycan/xylan/chitin deacetylase (PgdA/CDA1 family)